MRPFGRHRAVAFRVGAVAEAAVLLEQLLPGLDRRRRRGNRVLHLLGFRAATQVLRPGTHGKQGDTGKRERRNEDGRYATHYGFVSLFDWPLNRRRALVQGEIQTLGQILT